MDVHEQEPKQTGPNWGSTAALVVTVGIYLFAQILVGLILVVWPSLFGIYSESAVAWVDQHDVASQFVTMVLLEGITLLLLWRFLSRRRAKLSDLGLVKPKMHDIQRGLMGYVVYFAFFLGLSVALENVTPGLNLEQQQDIGYATTTSGTALASIFISLVVLPPLVEEILFRGFMYSGLRKRLTFVPAAIITSAIFGLAHLLGGEAGAVIWVATIDTFVLSLVLVYLREKYQTLWPSIVVHMLKNSMAFTVLFVLKNNFPGS